MSPAQVVAGTAERGVCIGASRTFAPVVRAVARAHRPLGQVGYDNRAMAEEWARVV